jgi:hypothetical protein
MTTTIAICGVLLGCGGSKSVLISNAWTDPGYSGRPKNNILVVGLALRHEFRTDYEYHLSREFVARGVGAAASVDGMPSDVELDKKAFIEYFGDKGFDAVLITGLVTADPDREYTPGTAYSGNVTYYDTFHGYYVAVYSKQRDPDYWNADLDIVFESNLYDVSSEKLMWQCISRPVKPEDVSKTVDDFSKTLINRLGQDGIVRLEETSNDS